MGGRKKAGRHFRFRYNVRCKTTERSLPVAHNIAKNAVVRTGSALVTDLADALDGDATSGKGRQERVSGWLARYDFVAHAIRSGHRAVVRAKELSRDVDGDMADAPCVGAALSDQARRGALPGRQAVLLDRGRPREGLPAAGKPAGLLHARLLLLRVRPAARRRGEETGRLLKTMKDRLGEIVENFRPFVANVRALLRMECTKYVSGRPRKRKPPDRTPFLPGFVP